MTPALVVDLKRGLLLVIAGMALGWLFDEVAFGISVALAALLAGLMHALWRLHGALRDHEPIPLRYRGLLGDIAKQLARLQRQARKRKKRMSKVVARYRQAAEANPDGAIIIDGQGCIEWLNKAAGRLLALRQGSDYGQPIANLIRRPGFSDWLRACDPEKAFELDSPHESASRLLLRVVPYGNAKRMVMVRDITRLQHLEQMRRDFVANVSHELRSPLTVLVGYLEGMREDERLPDRFTRPVAQMSQQSARMTRIVEDLLRLSRIESDPQAAASSPIRMDELIESLLRDANGVSANEHVLEQHVEQGALLLGDYNEIYSALSNLVFNAVQYTPAGGRISLNWTADPNGDGAQFVVCDSGEGIQAHHLPRLTERFYRVDKSRSREMGGTGLGLAIVKHVLMRHDAKLLISSEPGKGSEFSCEFPAHRVRREAVRTPEPVVAQRPAVGGNKSTGVDASSESG